MHESYIVNLIIALGPSKGYPLEGPNAIIKFTILSAFYFHWLLHLCDVMRHTSAQRHTQSLVLCPDYIRWVGK